MAIAVAYVEYILHLLSFLTLNIELPGGIIKNI